MRTVVALAVALALAGALVPGPGLAWHGGGHAASEPSVFPRPIDPWAHWPPPHLLGRHPVTPSLPPVVVVPPQVVVVPGLVWVPGHWAWTGSSWVWVPGHWTR